MNSVENSVSMIIGFQNANENDFHGFGNLVIWLWKSFGNFSKGVCTDPECWFLEEVDAVLEKYHVDYDGTE